MQDLFLLGVVLLLAAFGFYVMDQFDIFWESVSPRVGKNVIRMAEIPVLPVELEGVAELDRNMLAAGSRSDEKYKLNFSFYSVIMLDVCNKI